MEEHQKSFKTTGSVQILAGGYPKDTVFLMVIQDVNPLPSMKNVHPTDRLSLADPPQIRLSGFQVLVPQNDF